MQPQDLINQFTTDELPEDLKATGLMFANIAKFYADSNVSYARKVTGLQRLLMARGYIIQELMAVHASSD